MRVKPPPVLITASCLCSCRVLRSAAEVIAGGPVAWLLSRLSPRVTQKTKAHHADPKLKERKAAGSKWARGSASSMGERKILDGKTCMCMNACDCG